MQYPSIAEYVSSIQYASDNFATMNSLELVQNPDGSPVMSVGNFAAVFKMRDRNSGKLYAVKCFFREQEGREEAYKMITEELEYVSSNFLTSVRYLDKELFVDASATDETEFPVLVMDWVEGMTLDKYIRKQINDTYELSLLAYRFSRLVMWLLPQPFAHGDLKPDNILVREDGTLVLVDYDGMYVPAMKGEKARELGSPDFRHPDRTESDFDEHIDDYAISSILLSLKTIATCPSVLERYGAADRLLISENDARNISNCAFFKDYFPSEDMELNRLTGIFMVALSDKNLSNLHSRLLSLQKPQRVIVEQKADTIPISTKVTDEDLENAITIDGAKYSRDKKRLLKLKENNIFDFSILPGTKVICDDAFHYCDKLQQITIPNSVTNIGNEAFSWCKNLQQITIPNSVTNIGNEAFSWCKNLQQITIPNSVTHIGDSAFSGCKNLQQITIPNSVTHIGNYAFKWCEKLQQITIPNSVTHIEANPFAGCYHIRLECHSNHFIIDGKALFNKERNRIISCMSNDSTFTIPNSVTHIGDGAFSWCNNLQQITIPNSVTHIGDSAFWSCNNLQQITIPNSVTNIGDSAFLWCSNLQQITIPNSVTHIGERAFSGCEKLQQITIPNSVTHIGNSAFEYCFKLQQITIPNSVTHIGNSAFSFCSLQQITIPNSVTHIGNFAFHECYDLQQITIPCGARAKFEKLLGGYGGLLKEV